MPILIADIWNALREGEEQDENGHKVYVGGIVVTCYADTKYDKYYTGLNKKVAAERGASGKLFKEKVKDENGKEVKKKYSVRVYTKEEFTGLCIKVGFRFCNTYSNWNKKAYSKDSEDMIIIATK